jgi:hypothetical protein
MTIADSMVCWAWGYFAVSGLAIMLVAIARAEVKKLRGENTRLRSWQAAQGKAPDVGAYRAAPTSEVLTVYTENTGQCPSCGAHWMQDCDCWWEPQKPKPKPTTLPSGGRAEER